MFHLPDAFDKDGLALLKLALECLGLDVTLVEKIQSIRDALHQLNSHDSIAGRSMPLLCAILSEMSVFVSELDDLKKYTTDEAIKRCQERKDFGFARMIIKVCRDFTKAEFEKLRYVCSTTLGLNADFWNCSTIIEFVQRLFQSQKKEDTVKVLNDILTKMRKRNSLKYIDEYKCLIEFLVVPTVQGDYTVLYAVCLHSMLHLYYRYN